MMCIANTLMDIANESNLSKAEKLSLRLIAKEVKELQKDNKKLKKQLVAK